MNSLVQSLAGVLEEADGRLRAGHHAAPRVWPTGFGMLDDYLSGGFRSGELILLGGPQGLGKTTLALQMVRNVAAAGRSVIYFSFEHDPQTVLERLIAIEAGEIAGSAAVGLTKIRRVFETVDDDGRDAADRLAGLTGGVEALKAIEGYAARLILHRSTGSSTTLDTVREVVDEVRRSTGQLPFVVVDYLQKLHSADRSLGEDERVTQVVEGMKDLALELNVPVLAVVAADKDGISQGRRMRIHHLRGSSSLAYEADTVLIMNEKYDVVARHHLVYDLGNAERFRSWAVVTIEKNRNGLDKVELEFEKRFEQGRFERKGNQVVEQLVDERVFVD
ncbi:MAG: DnaB-like helicase C-terminal domain-containing protein [Nocardioidaceae bacterium]